MSEILPLLQRVLGDRYRVEREIGSGAMAFVYLAQDVKHGRPVAVKVLKPDLSPALAQTRFLKEIDIVAQLNHPSILPLYDSGVGEGLVYYVMPFVEGETLRASLQRQKRLSIDDTVETLRAIADGVAYAHDRGVVHRDLKPENILFQSQHALIADFGIARAAQAAAGSVSAQDETLTGRGISLGTPAYMAPEQVAADPAMDHRVDLYAIGIIAYELLTGEPPFMRNNPQQVLAAQITESPTSIFQRRPETPSGLAALVMRCLEKDPANRPQSAGEIGAALKEIAAAEAGSTLARAALAGQRKAMMRALLIYALAVITVGAVAWTVMNVAGLPDWVFPGALTVMVLVLPVVLLTGYVQSAGPRRLDNRGSSPRGFASLRFHARSFLTWSRTAAGGIAAVGMFGMGVGGFMTLRALGIGPAATLLSAGTLRPNERLILADFTVHGADSSLGPVLAAAARAALDQSGAVSIVEQTTVADALQRMQRPRSQAVDLEVAREIAVREGIKGIVHGEVTAIGGSYLVVMRLLAAESGKVLASSETNAADAGKLIPSVDKLSRRLRSKIGESLRDVRATPPLERATTPSLDALRKYSEGMRAIGVEGDAPAAVQLLQEAVALDSGFALAWRALWAQGITARMGSAFADTAITRAYRHRGRLTGEELDLLMAAYYMAGPGRDYEKAARAYEALFRRDSDFYTTNLGAIYYYRRDFRRAELEYRHGISRHPEKIFPYNALVAALYNQGKIGEAESVIQLTRERFPRAPVAPQLAIELLYNKGRFDEYRRALDSISAVSGSDLRRFALEGRANLALLNGQISDYRRRRMEARRTGSSFNNVYPVHDSIDFAVAEAAVENRKARAVLALDAAIPLRTSEVPAFWFFREMACAYSVAGRPDRARTMLDRYAREVKDTAKRRWQRPAIERALGELALAERRFDAAIEHFHNSDMLPGGPAQCPTCLALWIGRVYDAANSQDSAIAMFESYVHTPDFDRSDGRQPLDAVYLASVHERLGQLYDVKGDRERARRNYERFIELWKDADPELQPRVAAARNRVAALIRVASARTQ